MTDERHDSGLRHAMRARGLGAGIAVAAMLVLIALITLAMREHRVHTIRDQVIAGIATADGTRVAVAIFHAKTGAWPEDNAAAGLLSPSAVEGTYVDNVHIEAGKIVITLGGSAHHKVRGGHVVLTPYLDGSLVRWHCMSDDIRQDLLPDDCR